MSIKLIGSVLIIVGCGGVGFSMASAHRKEESALRRLISVLDHMGCELQYRLTPLPELCRRAAEESGGCIHQVLNTLADELANQSAPDAGSCMKAALNKNPKVPAKAKEILLQLGTSLGRFDLPGQMKGLEAARQTCRQKLDELSDNRDVRLRSYQTLGLCAGAALAVLFF